MITIPHAALADLHERFGHLLSEYDGLAEAIYEHDLVKTTKAAPVKERPQMFPGVRMSLPAGRVVQPVRVGVVLRKPANRA